jgi:hypothetical protein
MLKKAECKEALRELFDLWAAERGIRKEPQEQPSWLDFKSWLRGTPYSRYLNFRSTTSADDVAERWFDEVFKQTWRN